MTLSVTLSGLPNDAEASCTYIINNTFDRPITHVASEPFTYKFTPKVADHNIKARIESDGYCIIKTIEKTFKTCKHDRVNRDTGLCSGCNSRMAASVSSTHYADGRKYYETFDLALNAAWDVLKTSDCWFTMFQDAQVGTIEYQYLNVLGGKTLYMDLNGQTLTSRGVAFRVPAKEWKLNLSNGTVIGDTTNHKPVQGVIEVAAGGYLNVRDGTIQNKGADASGVNAPSIMVHGYSSNSGPVRGYAYIAGDKNSDFGSLFISGGDVTVNGGTYDHAKVTYGGSLEVSNGKFQGDVTVGDVTVDDHALLTVGSKSAYFDGKPYSL